jgi:hypothetical protein
MKKYFIFVLMMLVLVLPNVIFAQTSEPFDYKFNEGDFEYLPKEHIKTNCSFLSESVLFMLSTKNLKNTSGTKMDFNAAIKNNNEFPIINGNFFCRNI